MWRVTRRLAATRGRCAPAAALALCTVAALPGVAVAAEGENPAPYAYDANAQPVEGGGSPDAAAQLVVGATYRSSIGPEGGSQGVRYYRMELDATENVYVSVTAVPQPGSTVSSSDGISVTVRDAAGHTCSTEEAQLGPARAPRPISVVATRMIGAGAGADSGDASCGQAGTYSLLVERSTAAKSSPDEWGLEIRGVTEPGLRTAEPTTAPRSWDTSSPQPPGGAPETRPGGSGFSAARELGQGTWRDHIEPGRTLFYRVPVSWGQQIAARAELAAPGGSGGSGATGGGYVSSALVMALYNPVRDAVDAVSASYQGERASAAFSVLPPVAYRNRHATQRRISGMRLGGSYYLALSLDPQVAQKFGDRGYEVTLDVTVRGDAQQSPDYAGVPRPAQAFDVTPPDQRTGGPAGAADDGDGDHAMRLLGVGAVSTGTVLLLVLGCWTLLARRQAAGMATGVPTSGTGAGGGE